MFEIIKRYCMYFRTVRTDCDSSTVDLGIDLGIVQLSNDEKEDDDKEDDKDFN